jgi:hypothetical protein
MHPRLNYIGAPTQLVSIHSYSYAPEVPAANGSLLSFSASRPAVRKKHIPPVLDPYYQLHGLPMEGLARLIHQMRES